MFFKIKNKSTNKNKIIWIFIKPRFKTKELFCSFFFLSLIRRVIFQRHYCFWDHQPSLDNIAVLGQSLALTNMCMGSTQLKYFVAHTVREKKRSRPMHGLDSLKLHVTRRHSLGDPSMCLKSIAPRLWLNNAIQSDGRYHYHLVIKREKKVRFVWKTGQ
jgi:hypothetical protein